MRTTNILAVIVILIIVGLVYYMNVKESDKPIIAMSKEKYDIQSRTIDSLNNVVDSLQMEIFTIEDGCDYKEHSYEDILFEYELGVSYLKDYHPKAYKDFHRIIGMREDYSTELERENTKMLNQYKNK